MSATNPNDGYFITAGPKRPNLHRRRSSLPNVKIVPLTMAERRLMARRKRKDEEEARKRKKEQEAEEKRQRAKQLRLQTRTKDREHARKVTILGSCVHCRYCDDMIEEMEFDEHKVSHPTQIRERIWLGNAENSQSLHDIKKCGITHILNCTREIDLPKNISKKIKSFKRIAIQDKNIETILDYIVESNQFIEKALGDSKFHVVFVHCREGRSRSVSFLSAYLMWKEKVSFHAVLSDITSKRHIVLPNNKFYGELEKLDKQLVKDRKGNLYKRYGKPSNAFKLQKLKGNQMKYMNQQVLNSVFGYPDKYTDDVKFEEYPEILEKRESVRNILLSPTNSNSDSHRRRRSSLTDIAFVQYDATSPMHRASMGIAVGMNGVDHSYNYQSKLSPVAGSPSTKKKKASDPWRDAARANKTRKKSKEKESKSAKKGSKKKKKKKSKKAKEDFDVEEAMDVSDIFGADNKKKKKKVSKNKKKNSSKKKKKTNE